MNKLTCESCGSVDVVKSDDFFVCQSCGKEYTKEDAQRLINVKVNVSSDSISLDKRISNYLELARNALKNNNYQEANTYAHKILDFEDKNPDAWYIKALVAGYNNPLTGNYDITECINSFQNSYMFSPAETQKSLQEKINGELTKIIPFYMTNISHIFDVCGIEHLSDHISVLCKFANDFNETCMPWYERQDENEKHKIINLMALSLSTAIGKAWNSKIFPALPQNDHISLGEKKMNLCLLYAESIIEVYKMAITMGADDRDNNILRYKSIIDICHKMIVALTYGLNKNTFQWHPGYTKNKKLIKELLTKISEYNLKIKELDPTYVIPGNKYYLRGTPFAKSRIGCIVLLLLIIVIAAVAFFLTKVPTTDLSPG